MKRVNITKEFIRSITPPASGRDCYYDSKVPRLCIVVTPMGAKSWYRYGRVNGRPQRYRIGSVEDFTIKQARDECQRLNAEVGSRKDPMELRRSQRAEKTLVEAFNWVLEHRIKPRKKAWKKDEQLFKNHLAPFSKRRISTLTTEEIQEHHTKTEKRSGSHAANAVCKLLRRVYRVAVKQCWTDGNPAEDVVLADPAERDRFLSESELVRWFDALESLSSQTAKDFFLLCLFTAARRGNVASMRWEELDLEAGEWTIRKEKYKNKKAVSLVLVRQAIEILERRRKEVDSDWVFPSTRSKTGHFTEPKTSWKNLCKTANLDDVRMHDLRRTLASWQAKAGASLPIIGKSLGQRSLAATQIYARLDLEPIRLSVSAAADAIEAAGKKSQK